MITLGRQTYLIRRGGAYSARLRVPKDLIEAVGRKELVKALGTNDPVEANRRVRAVVDGWLRQFDSLRNRSAMSDDDKAELIWSHYTGTLDRDEHLRATIPTESEIDRAAERAVERAQRENIDIKDPIQLLDAALELHVLKDRRLGSKSIEAQNRKIKLDHLRKHLTQGETALVDHEIEAYLDHHSLIIERADRADLARQLIRAEIEALQRTMERDEGNYGVECHLKLTRYCHRDLTRSVVMLSSL